MQFLRDRVWPRVEGDGRVAFTLIGLTLAGTGVLILLLIGWIGSSFNSLSAELASASIAAGQERVANAFRVGLAPISGMAESLAHSRAFADAHLTDDLALLDQPMNDADAVRLANANEIDSFLRSSIGPTQPFTTGRGALRQVVSPRQLTRGLPSRWRGATPARDRRQLASALIEAHPTVVGVVQLDVNGDVVLLHPYNLQLRLTRLKLLSGIDLSRQRATQQPATAIASAAELGAPFQSSIAFLSPVSDDRAQGWVGVILNQSSLAVPAIPFELRRTMDSSVVASDYRGRPGIAAGLVPFDLGNGYQLRTVASTVGPATSRSLSVQLALVVFAVCVGLMWGHRQFADLLNLRDKLGRRLSHARRALEDKSHRVAHDLRNVSMGLKALNTSVRSKLDANEMRRFDGCIEDLNGHAEFISTRLAAESLGFSEGQVVSTPTYLRGALDTVLGQTLPGDARITRVQFDEELGNREPFVSVPSAELSRIVGNIVRNAVEACEGRSVVGVSVTARRQGTNVAIRIADTGAGVPPALRERMFEDGFSTKQGTGRGRGLASARERVLKYGGQIGLATTDGQVGATIELLLPLAETPTWFANTLNLSNKSTVVIVDDELVAFEYWDKSVRDRFASLNASGIEMPRLIHLQSPAQLEDRRDLIEGATHFLVDHHFEGISETGIRLIDRLGLGTRAILVTNLFEQQALLEEATRRGIKILPKPHVLNARINIVLEQS